MQSNISDLLYSGMQGLFYFLLLAFTIHTLFLAYHWFAYGNSKQVSLVALATYLSGGAILLLTYSFALSIL